MFLSILCQKKIEAHVLFFFIYQVTSLNLRLEPNYAGVSKDSAAPKATEFSSVSKIYQSTYARLY